MKFYWHEKESSVKNIIDELIKQYADNFSHVSMQDWNTVIKHNLLLLEMVRDELKSDAHLEYKRRHTTIGG